MSDTDESPISRHGKMFALLRSEECGRGAARRLREPAKFADAVQAAYAFQAKALQSFNRPDDHP